jgi:hypothetical protein
MEKKSTAQEIAEISDFFLSSHDKEKVLAEYLSDFRGGAAAEGQEELEVEETVSIRKKMAYPNTEKAQESMRRSLFQYLEDDFRICRIELTRTAHTSTPRSKKERKEEVVLFLKDGLTR